MSKKFHLYGLILGCLVAVLAPAVAQAQVCEPLDNGRMAIPRYEGTLLLFEPIVEFREMVLTITGPCEDIVRVFGPKDTIAFDIREIERVTDGQYSWELRRVASIDPGVQEDLQAARGTGEEDALWWSYFQKGAIPEGPYVDSGAFSVVKGQIVDPTGVEERRASVSSKAGAALAGASLAGESSQDLSSRGAGDNSLATKDVVFNDDLIVIGSSCVGFDCVNGEVFGFDTIRLKENNLRIQFNDTSGSSFPTTNWQIRANSSQSGGENFLGFMDQGANGESENGTRVFAVEAGAGSNALFVESGGDAGFGTGNPVLNLHVVDGDSPGLRLEQDGSSGFQPQIWDIAGNETNFFVRDVTSGSTLPFRIFPGSSSSSLVVRNSNVGMGTSSPNAPLHIVRNGVVRYRLGNSSAGTEWDTNNDGSGNYAISIVGSGQNELVIGQDGNIGNCNNPDHDFVISTGPGCTATPRSWIDAGDTGFSITSSRAFKENLHPVEVPEILTRIREIPVYEYDFVDGPQDRIGLVAEDFHQVFGRGSEAELSGHEMQLAMWLAIQELDQRDQQLEAKNSEIEDLKSRLQALERVVETLATDR